MSEFDLSYLNEISGGDEDFIKEMIETFLEETPKDLADVKTHLANENWEELGKTAHKMKSSIKMFGYGSVKDQAFFIEQSGKKNENIDALPGKTHEFIVAVDHMIAELNTKL
ncbi:MAG: Hpt domain-containing protein [Bacteroidia bacterium]